MNRRTYLAAVGGVVFPLAGWRAWNEFSRSGYAVRNLDVSRRVVYPTHEYQFSATGRLDGLDDHEVDPVRPDALDPAVRDAVRRIVEADGGLGFDDPPPGLFEAAENHAVDCRTRPGWCPPYANHLLLDYADTDPDAVPVASLDAAVTDGDLRVSISAPDGPLRVSSGRPGPFGVLSAVGADGTDHRFALRSESYDRGGVMVSEDDDLFTTLVLETTEVAPRETLSQTYEAAAWAGGDPAPGRYVLSASSRPEDIPLPVEYESPALADGQVVDFRVEFDLVER